MTNEEPPAEILRATSPLLSAALALLAGGVGAYVAAVASRAGAGHTTLGTDIVCAVWTVTISLVAVGAFRWLRTEGKRKSVPHLFAIVIPMITLAAWTWLTVSGHVISHDAMMATK